MKTKLIMFEGIPGSGKSTLARKSTLFLNKKKVENCLYREGCLHPANLYGYAIIPANELETLVSKFPKYEDKIRGHMIPVAESILIQCQKIYRSDNVVFQYLKPYAVWWNSDMDYDLFGKLHKDSWSSFARRNLQTNTTAIFECAFLQDHITELMLFYDKPESDIIGHFKNLEESILTLNPFLFYLQQNDANETIERITKQRINEPDGRPWGERVAELVSTSPYGKSHNLNGYDGMVEFFKRRKEIDLAVIHSLEIKHVLVDNNDYDWNAVQKKVFEVLGCLADV